MALYAVIELLADDGSPAKDGQQEFDLETLKWMERDREAGGYLTLDSDNYAIPAKVVGVVQGELDEGRPVIRPLASS